MNRFLKNKKEKVKEAKEAKEAKQPKEAKVDEQENEFSIPGMNSFTKNKKPEPEPKPEFDLSTALPSNDDFRTSLLMPKLSARFSMLKEQDNPDSMLGKASDDSVLFPKRASRLNIFGHNPGLLSDIDEVSLADGSRPSFTGGRAESYVSAGDGYGTDDDRSQSGSIMNRPRRGEGNTLFGGRQKVYKIPVKSTGTSPTSETGRSGMGGRAIYDDDLSLSPFQRMRLKEKQERAAEAASQNIQTPESEDALSRNPSVQRTTYSSTTSGPAAGSVSTAATSFDESYAQSQPHAPAGGAGDVQKAPGKPPSMPMAAERGSVRNRRLYGQGLAQAAQNQQTSTLHRLESLSRQRAPTPEWPQLNRNYSRSAANLRDRLQKLAIAEPTSSSRPTSPPSSATSPKRLTVENEHKELKPHAYGSVPPLTPPVTENDEGALAAAVQPEDKGKATAMGIWNKPNTQFDEQQFTRRQLQMHEGRNTPPLSQTSSSERVPTHSSNVHPREVSNPSHRSRAGSASSSTGPQRITHTSAAPSMDGTGTFLADSRSSESGDETDHRRSVSASSNTSQSMDNIHPAFRSSTASKMSTASRESQNAIPEVRYSDLSDLKPIEEDETVERDDTNADITPPEKPDSPTLGPTGLGLSGLVRTHLRRGSDRSSICPLPSPSFPPPQTSYEPEPTNNLTPASNDATAQFPEGQSSSQRTSGETQLETQPSEHQDRENESIWPRSRHSRDASSETQKEREEFEIELAERRRKVQEKLKNFAESESRAGSPVPGRQTPDLAPSKTSNAFSILRNKHKQNGGVFGLGNASTPALLDRHSHEDSERFPYSFGRHANTSSPHVGAERHGQSRMPTVGRSSQENSRESSRSRGPSPHSSFRMHRDRSGSGSDTSRRSKSRNRYRERDDLGPLDEGSVASHGRYPFPEYTDYRSPSIPSSVPSSTRPSLEGNDHYDRSTSASGRYRSSSRSGTSSHHDLQPRPLQLLHPSESIGSIGSPPRPSPIAPYSANATPPLYELPPEKPRAAFSNNPPSSHGIPQRAPGHTMLQKRAVNKLQISQPTFVSTTSNVPTVGLPPGATLGTGAEAPPVPPMNPRRRRQTTTQTILGALKGDRPELHHPTLTDEQRSVSDGVERASKPRNRLRKSSSEGGQMNVRARQEVLSGVSSPPPPPMPQYPHNIPMDGGMI